VLQATEALGARLVVGGKLAVFTLVSRANLVNQCSMPRHRLARMRRGHHPSSSLVSAVQTVDGQQKNMEAGSHLMSEQHGPRRSVTGRDCETRRAKATMAHTAP
jgi:hypothetical protein